MTAVATAAAPHPTIALLQTSSLASVVQGELERMILAGELRPGDKLTEMALAARLGVSRGPLREAFRMLDEAGLVRTEKTYPGLPSGPEVRSHGLEVFAAERFFAGDSRAGLVVGVGLIGDDAL